MFSTGSISHVTIILSHVSMTSAYKCVMPSWSYWYSQYDHCYQTLSVQAATHGCRMIDLINLVRLINLLSTVNIILIISTIIITNRRSYQHRQYCQYQSS